MKVTCIYHSRDLDGLASGAIVRRWCDENNHDIELVGWDYGLDIPADKIQDCDILFICDVSFPKEVMEELYDDGINMVWCDHHKSNLDDSEDMNYGKCDGIRNITYAGCELTWQYCFPDDDVPIFIEYLGKYDSHREMDDDSKDIILYIQYAARAYISGIDDFEDSYIDSAGILDAWLDDGRAIYTYLKTDAKETYKNHKFDVEIDGHKCVCVSKERFNPMNYGIDYHADNYEMAICFWYKPEAGVWEFSIYNEDGTVDCAEIAKKIGGGGHVGAAGFTVEDINTIIKQK